MCAWPGKRLDRQLQLTTHLPHSRARRALTTRSFAVIGDILDSIGRTALVPLPRISEGLPVSILAKCEHMNPGGSVKDRIAKAIVDAAEELGILGPGMTLIEATAGNTGIGLALVAAARGYKLV